MEALVAYYGSKRSQLCEDCKRRLVKSPLRLLDCKDPGCAALKEGAPHIVDLLDEDCKNKLMRVLEFLDDLQVPYVLNPHLVRGFDYYTRTVFEIVYADENEGQPGSQAPVALGGGGRYDNLRSEEHTSELQSQFHLVCRLLLVQKVSTHALAEANKRILTCVQIFSRQDTG